MGSPEKAMERTSGGHSAPVNSALYDEAYFLSECEGYEEFIASGGQLLSRRLVTALDSAEVEPGMRVLDVGCGRGESLVWLSRQGAMAWGLDYSSEALRIAKGLIATGICEVESKGLLLSANAEHLPFPTQSLDRVLMLDIVEHLHPWELSVALQEAHRVLKPRGKLIVHTAPNRWYYRFGYPLFRLFQYLRGVKLPQDPKDRFRCHRHVHVNEQSLVSLRRNLGRAGFRSRLWVDDTQARWREQGRLGRLAGWIVTRLYPFKWIFCGDIFAVAWRAGRDRDHR
jgi:cyclopropane fatty-acyl-phospholipid synthase-like methyltransferase